MTSLIKKLFFRHLNKSCFTELLNIELYKYPNEFLFINLHIHLRMEKSIESCFFKIKFLLRAPFQDYEVYEVSSKGLEINFKQTPDITLKFIILKYGTF